MHSYTHIAFNQGDWPRYVEMVDSQVHSEVVIPFRTNPTASDPATTYLCWRDDTTDSGAECARRFAHWLETLAEHIRDEAHKRDTRNQLELLSDRQVAADLDVTLADDDKAPF